MIEPKFLKRKYFTCFTACVLFAF